MARRGGDAEAFLAARDGRVVDRLDIDAVAVQQEIAGALGGGGVADQQGQDVRRVLDEGDVERCEGGAQVGGVLLLQPAVGVLVLLVCDGGAGAGQDGRGEAGREDEARSEGADRVDEGGSPGDVAAYAAVGFAERACDDVDSVRDGAGVASGEVGGEVEMFGYAGTGGTVHADCVDFVKEGQGPVLFCEVADAREVGDTSAHRVDGFDGDDLRCTFGLRLEHTLELSHVIVGKDHLSRLGVADTFNHGGMVVAVGQDHAVW